jgi:hypothetical protein
MCCSTESPYVQHVHASSTPCSIIQWLGVSRKTGPKFPTIGLDYGYKSSFSLNHRFNHYDRRI